MAHSGTTAVPRTWFKRPTTLVAWAVLLVAVIHPPHGLGLPICWMAGTTGVPCPGCGLTRSMSCAVHGMFHTSWQYHPFGMVFLAGFACVAGLSLLPRGTRQRLSEWAGRRVRMMNVGYGVFIGAFLAHGVVRAALHYLHTSPLR